MSHNRYPNTYDVFLCLGLGTFRPLSSLLIDNLVRNFGVYVLDLLKMGK